jgi:sulfoxide reductase heme-binding subunit YedZ
MSPAARRASTAALFLVCLVPAALLGWDAARGALTDPIKESTHRTGWWALALLVVTLAVTPARRLTGWNGMVKYRRMLGLFAFFYACLHFLTYLVLDQFFAWEFIVEDVAKRPYITVGFAAFLMLLSLALTSTNGWIRRLGKRWQRLHALIYVAALAGVVHFLWQVKADVRVPTIFGLVIVALLAFRLLPRRHRRAAKPSPAVEKPLLPARSEQGGIGVLTAETAETAENS